MELKRQNNIVKCKIGNLNEENRLTPEMRVIGCKLNFDKPHEIFRSVFTRSNIVFLTRANICLRAHFWVKNWMTVFGYSRSRVRETLYDCQSL